MQRKLLIRAMLAGCITACLWFGSAIAAEAPAPHPAWPHVITADHASVEIFQPQAIDWKDYDRLTARAAIAITRQDSSKPLLGTIEVTLQTHTDAATEIVSLSHPSLITTHFPSLDTTQAIALEEKLRHALPQMQVRQVPLSAILLSLKQTSHPATAELNNAPPEMFYRDKPASLVVFDGEPVLAPVGKSGLHFAVNTNWDVFTEAGSWYLLNSGLWLSAPAWSGPWHPVTHLPAAFSHMPNDRNFAEVRKAIPPKPDRPAVAPEIIVTTKPADIIVTDGPPHFTPINGTTLQAVSNTNADLFFQPSSGTFFVLTSGRWFSARALTGPWTFASGKLPPDFALIPEGSAQAHVLHSVPGTSEAELAVLRAQVPQQATLKRGMAKVTVVYAGTPHFKPIPGTSLKYAVNTSYQVIETGGHYYVCYQGAWFVGSLPTGPWVLAAAVPEVIYAIPPSSPMYNVTYVKVYGSTPVTVTYGYTAGYMMGFISAGVVVYGTGYYYPPVVIAGPVPIFYPYPYTYIGRVVYNPANGAWVRGGAVYGPNGGVARGGTYYNPSSGAWARGGAVYGPNGGAGAFSYYNPRTGGYAHGSAAWGGGSGWAQASYYNPRTGVSGSTNQNWNPYSRWGSSTISGPDRTINTASASNARGTAGGFSSSTGAKGAGYRGANGNRGGVVQTKGGDTYAGHDGNVYRHDSDGWSKWSDGGWQPVNPPKSPGNSPRAARNNQSSSPSAGERQASRPDSRPSPAGGRTNTSLFQQLERDRQARLGGARGGFAEGLRGNNWRDRFDGGDGSDRFGNGDRDRFGGGMRERFRR